MHPITEIRAWMAKSENERHPIAHRVGPVQKNYETTRGDGRKKFYPWAVKRCMKSREVSGINRKFIRRRATERMCNFKVSHLFKIICGTGIVYIYVEYVGPCRNSGDHGNLLQPIFTVTSCLRDNGYPTFHRIAPK